MDEQREKYLRQIEEAVKGLRSMSEPSATGAKPWDRMMLSVLAEFDRRGGRLHKSLFADIGESYGYDRHGMGGFYQGLVERDGSFAVLSEAGRERLDLLRSRYEELPPAAA